MVWRKIFRIQTDPERFYKTTKINVFKSDQDLPNLQTAINKAFSHKIFTIGYIQNNVHALAFTTLDTKTYIINLSKLSGEGISTLKQAFSKHPDDLIILGNLLQEHEEILKIYFENVTYYNIGLLFQQLIETNFEFPNELTGNAMLLWSLKCL